MLWAQCWHFTCLQLLKTVLWLGIIHFHRGDIRHQAFWAWIDQRSELDQCFRDHFRAGTQFASLVCRLSKMMNETKFKYINKHWSLRNILSIWHGRLYRQDMPVMLVWWYEDGMFILIFKGENKRQRTLSVCLTVVNHKFVGYGLYFLG